MYIQVFCDTFSLTNLEANELSGKTEKLSKAFLDLRNAYNTDYIRESREYADKKAENTKKEGAKKLLGFVTNRLSKEAKQMWEAHKQAQTAQQEFKDVYMAHNIAGSLSETITTAFQICHENRKISDPDSVIEGRRVFEVLQNEKQLGKIFGCS